MHINRRLAREGRASSPTNIATDTIALMATRAAKHRSVIPVVICLFFHFLFFVFRLGDLDPNFATKGITMKTLLIYC